MVGLLFFCPGRVDAHGVGGEVSTGGTAVTARYSDGTPMSYARVKISAPDGGPTFQSGRSDRNGRFCFYPDGPGTWTVVVDDEMGHRLSLAVPVDANAEPKPDGAAADSRPPVWMGAAAGIGVIFGLTGIFLWWKSRTVRESANRKKAAKGLAIEEKGPADGS
jgi:nickel transport protein